MKSLKEILRSLEGLSDIELFVIDLFCGAGGLSEGVEEARLDGNRCGKVVCCVNHDKNAILSHDANIPDALHFIEDIRTLELSPISTIVERIRQLYPDAMIMLHASLECTNFSKAKGGQPRDADSRTLAEHLFRYIDVIDPDYIQIENVEEFMSWGDMDENGKPISMDKGRLYQKWVRNVKKYGYNFEHRILKGFTMPQSEPKLMDITVTQFQRIRDMVTSDSKLILARDLFLLSFYLGGINLADLVETDLSSKTMTYVRKKSAEHKTGERTTSLTIPDEAKTIINKYILGNRLNLSFCNGYKNLQRYVNKCFAALAQHIGIQTSFSYYAGRKTFAQFAFMIGIRTEVVEYCIGQSVKKNRPIYNYVRVMQKQADAAVRKVIQYTVDPESFEIENIP